MCLGKDDRVDLRQAVRASSSDVLLNEAIDTAMRRKPLGHDFIIDRRGRSPTLTRHMSVTGG
jgi:cyclic pyranopterin phosphate synthase